MLRFLGNLVAIGMVVAGLSQAQVVLAAEPHDVPHKEKSSGTITKVTSTSATSGHLEFAGTGMATHFGNYSQTGGNDFAFVTATQGLVQNGTFTTTAADGSTITGVYCGTFTVHAPNLIEFDVTATWQTGTGRLAGVTGQALVVAFLNGVFPGASYTYTDAGFLTFP
jgi:hypothetical protein